VREVATGMKGVFAKTPRLPWSPESGVPLIPKWVTQGAVTRRYPKPLAYTTRNGLPDDQGAALVEKIYYTKIYPESSVDRKSRELYEKRTTRNDYLPQEIGSELAKKGIDTTQNKTYAKYSKPVDRIESTTVAGQTFKLYWRKTVLVNYDHFYGIGRPTLRMLLRKLGIAEDTKMSQLSERKRKQLEHRLESAIIMDKERIQAYIDDRLMHHQRVQSFKGERQRYGYPSRGQSSHTNAQSSKWISRKIDDLLKKERLTSADFSNPNMLKLD
jgi:ribosomal protein S13